MTPSRGHLSRPQLRDFRNAALRLDMGRHLYLDLLPHATSKGRVGVVVPKLRPDVAPRNIRQQMTPSGVIRHRYRTSTVQVRRKLYSDTPPWRAGTTMGRKPFDRF